MEVTAFVVGLSSAGHAQMVTLTVDSDPGDSIGAGQHKTVVYTPNDQGGYPLFDINDTYEGGTDKTTMIRFILGQPANSNETNTFALIYFGTNKLGHELRPGFYDNAERAIPATDGHPGLDFSFQNRGANSLTGNFTIHSVNYGPGPAGLNIVNDLDVSFEQFAQGSTGACRGRVTYLSSVPEPMTLLTLSIGILVLRRRSRTRPYPSTAQRFRLRHFGS